MSRLSLTAAVTLVLSLSFSPARAQDNAATVAAPSCLSDWACGAVRPPLGFYIDSISEDGRYITLEDGTRWEVQAPDRAIVAGWVRDDFVTIREIAAPSEGFEWQLTKVDNTEWRAAVRLAGRTRRPE